MRALLTLTLIACRSPKSDVETGEVSSPATIDDDGDGFDTEEDCDDSDPLIGPDAPLPEHPDCIRPHGGGRHHL